MCSFSIFIQKFTLYDYICENNFHAFSSHENIFTEKKAIYDSTHVQYVYMQLHVEFPCKTINSIFVKH